MTVWSTKFINDLPDSSFLYARKRLFPYKNSDGEIDGALVESALTDIASSNLSAPVKANLMTRAKAIAKRTAEAELWSYIRLQEAAFKTEGGLRFSARAYAYVPDREKPSTWKIRLEETPGKVTVRQLGRAAAAFSAGGFRGRRVQIPANKVAAVKAKIRAAYRKLGVGADKMPRSIRESAISIDRLSEPYARNSELPKSVRNSLPARAQTIWRNAYNAAEKKGWPEKRRAQYAWGAVKKAFKKATPKWVLKETDMGTKLYRRLSEAIWGIKIDRLKADVGRRKEALMATSAKREEAPAPEAMQESYVLPAEALSEVASWQQGDERILRNCTFIKAGLNKPKTRRWKPEVLEAHLDAFDGSLCYIDHPAPGEPRSLRALAGHTRNPRYDKATESVVGDIVLLDNNEAADYVVSVFGNETIRNSGAAGLSVLWEGGHYDFDVEDYHGRTIQVPTKLSGKCQVDFVANPTAFGAVGEV